MTERTDKERLDFLQRLTEQDYAYVTCRWSASGRGWRLHECSGHPRAEDSVRQAIDNFIDEHERWLDGRGTP
jgi:hypothetical protein